MEKTKSKEKVVELTLCAVFIAFVYVATQFINIKLPLPGNGGLIHLGNVPLFFAAAICGKKVGCIAGGVGMGLFDLLSGAYAVWAPFTLIICGAIGYVFGWIAYKKGIGHLVLAVIAACFIKIIGYYFAEVIIYGNLIIPVSSIPGNIVQIITAGIIAIPIIIGAKQLDKLNH